MFVLSDSIQLEEKLQNRDFLKQVSFLPDITNHLNELKLKRQERNQLVLDLIANVNGFYNNLKIFRHSLEKINCMILQSCRQIVEKFKNDEIFDSQNLVQVFNKL